jgi:C-terminal processing protease CtpA/Prc
MPKPWVEVDETKKKLTIKLGPFVGAFIGTKYEKKYVDDVQHALRQSHPESGSAPLRNRQLVIDLRHNGGGSERVMLKALRGIEKWGRGTVLVGPHTASAGEMVAAALIYDYKFKRKGGRTAGMLSHMKNIILKDGSFLGVTAGHYTTPGGHLCKRFYL